MGHFCAESLLPMRRSGLRQKLSCSDFGVECKLDTLFPLFNEILHFKVVGNELTTEKVRKRCQDCALERFLRREGELSKLSDNI